MTASLTSSIEHAIPGDYQLRALQQGWRLQRAWHRARLDLIAQVLPPAAEGLILDAASGSGIVTWKFKERRIVSADMRVSAGAATRRHTSGARAVAALVDALPFFSGTFTQAYLLEAIEHLGEDEGVRALREMARVCRPGGTCLITTPNYRSHWRLIERALDRWGPTPPLGDAQHVTKYRPRPAPEGSRSSRLERDETRIVQPRRADRRSVLCTGRRVADGSRSLATPLQRSSSLRGLPPHVRPCARP